ncbi:hypothetical protein KKY_2650 [Pelagibacterium halotolerans B2]|uniref:Uncharacterized protein n=1 Tax=Pelagibacterium halotolerans (strain DSM 22347 / JCM 15775 / CGMCC 1.7692 / B2) TaxID=1082931 RepID=G4RBI2_PELHB|nr:hypothetical protein KKY_2650 [Pelagibacterium halotolerans B2]
MRKQQKLRFRVSLHETSMFLRLVIRVIEELQLGQAGQARTNFGSDTGL